MKTKLLFFVALLAFVLAAAAPIVRAQRADLVYSDLADTSTLDQNRMSWAHDVRVGYALYEGLYSLAPETFKPIPGAAEKIDISPDKTAYTFTMRANGRWTNGEPVTAQDFVFSWRRMLENPADYTYLLHYIKGAKEYEAAYKADPKTADFANVMIKAVDEKTLVVTLNHPVTFFPELCSFTPYWPVNEKSMQPFKQVDSKTGRVSYDEKFTHTLVGNGAYRLKEFTLKVGLKLEKNEHYWDKENVQLKTIDKLTITDPLTAINKYEAGEIDWLTDTSGDIAASMIAKKRDDIHTIPAFGTYFYSVNCNDKLPNGQNNPLKDPKVRRALSMAIDRETIVKTITRCNEQPTGVYVPTKVFEGYVSPQGNNFDVRAARALMKEAGFTAGKGFPRLKLLYNNEGDHRTIAQFVAKCWKQNLNVDFDLEGIELAQFRHRLKGADYDIARASWFGDYFDISTFTDKYLSNSENNDSKWFNPAYDALLAKAAVEGDAAKRTAMLAEAEKMLIEEMPIIPLFNYTNKSVYRNKFKNLGPTTLNLILFKYIRKE